MDQDEIAAQMRAGRALLDWSQADLARAAGVSTMTVKRSEGSGRPFPAARAIDAMRAALRDAGVEFLPASRVKGPGVRLAE